MNTTTFVGNLTADPKLIEGASGKMRATFTVAVNEGQGEDERTHFLSVTAFGTLGENLAKSLTKGQRVIVSGRVNTYKKEVEIDGEAKSLTMTGFTASAAGPDLRFATAQVSKVARSVSFDQDEADAGSGNGKAAPASAKSSAGSSKAAAVESDEF